ncbi:MAG TPA: pyridoxal phosphate-dependent aminotransferase [Bryobacteraceae bacterium]|nr:pyridoxal phosphate-dependent aminotransferase [Bryobacteraceae bacterium]
MSLSHVQVESFLERGFTRRQLGRIASLLTAGAALPFYSEFSMAQDARRRTFGEDRSWMYAPDVIRIDQNENPMGPCKEGLEAIAKIAPHGWRYSAHGEQQEFMKALAESEGLKPEYVAAFAGSSDPLHRIACAFTSPTRSWVMADPGYGGGAPEYIGSKCIRVPLASDYSHDVKAMLKADPNAGVYYICNPNNPSGTVTSRQDIEYLLANKSKDAIVLVDEAYLHFSDKVEKSTDLAGADKDLIILRTFSKIYAMAGLRAGAAIARPDLLAKIRPYGPGFLPITGIACATASLKVPNLVPERRALNKRIRDDVFAFLDKKNISFVPSQTNFFMMEVGRPGAEFAKAMVAEKIVIGRIWPIWPTKVRISIGTEEEMARFKAAVSKILV